MKRNIYKEAKLVLEDGTVFKAWSFGHEASSAGEIVFTTAMTGYPESLTDPSYKGQILVLTYPSIGNYGVPENVIEHGLLQHFESDRIHAAGLIISDYSVKYNHWNASKSLGNWLKEHKIPALFGLDTRRLTKILRDKGTMLAKIIIANVEVEFVDPSQRNLVAEVSAQSTVVYGSGSNRILLMDCGVKSNIIRCLLRYDTTVIRVPWDYDINPDEYDGLFISNGPGDPTMCKATIDQLQKVIDTDKPIFGICLGHQLLALASGAKTYKLKFGHRSHNQPVLEEGTNKAWLTSQNHGYAVDANSIDSMWAPYFTNLNDGSNEGLKHRTKAIFSTQFHPEASSGPTDTAFLFSDFINAIERCKQ